MRISRDDQSWAARGVLRRDFRHTHAGPEVPRRRGRRKDTLRWCRGRIGLDHVLERYPRWYSTVRIVDPVTGTERTEREPRGWSWRCGRCGRSDVDRFPLHLRTRIDPAAAKHLELARRWCGDGHLYGTTEVHSRWSWCTRSVRACVMCGRCRSDRRGFVAVTEPAQLHS